MTGLNTTELAARLAVSKARISQYVSEGKLEGCYTGDGRGRRFDLEKVAHALGRKLHPGQMLGNGAATRDALRDLGNDDLQPAAPRPRTDAALPVGDPDRYEMARTLKAEEEARRLRRQNMAEERTWVLAEEVERHTARAMTQEIAQFETMLRDAARAVADQFGLDFRSVRKVLMDEWRRYRAARSSQLGDQAQTTAMTPDEQEADV
ncbi:hypothetical protein [Paracoccus sp. SSJ]|uniref:hypothetical protein n=1 Tax=Paracoccus sp. SSJ TaxID=3050636 RepID=UPI00254A1EF8|nr:hypothetical protein [Paracoccus sp. SSJ]MDK8874695.1 hypothetical protein [Paracoccus sp. SSJ]